MGDSPAPQRRRTSRKKEPLSVLYAACGLAFRTGCGPSEHVLSLARELGKRPGINMTLLFAHTYDPVPTGPYCVKTLGDPGLRPERGAETDSLILGINPIRYLRHRSRVLRFVAAAKDRYQVVVERMWGFGGLLAGALKKSGVPVVLEENGPITWQGGIRSAGDLFRLAYLMFSRSYLRRAYRHGKFVIVQTDRLAERLVAKFGVSRDRLTVIPNGVDLTRFDMNPSRETIPKQDPSVWVYAGTLDGDHDLLPLIQALEACPQSVEIRFLGSGPMRRELQDLAVRAIHSRIRFLGRVAPQEVVTHLQEADLCLAPYGSGARTHSGFQYAPLKILEYAAAGKPVVVAGASPEQEAVKEGVNGFFIDNIAKAWIDLFHQLPDRSKLAAMGKRGVEHVNSMGWDSVAAQIYGLLHSAAKRVVVAPIPFTNPENRYIELLHHHLESTGVRILDPGVLRLSWLKDHAGIVDVLHLHWPESHYQFPNRIYALLKWLYLFLRLKAAIKMGYVLAWTAHNLEAHDRRLRGLDRRLRHFLLKNAGTVMLGEGTRAALETYYGTPPVNRSAVIRHGHYINCYGESWDQEEARRALGLPGDKTILLFLGTLRRYKGLADLVDAFSMLKYDDLFLTVAGKVADPGLLDELRPRLEAEAKRVRLFSGFIPDNQVALFLCAADFMVLPYQDVHMSGAMILAMSYGCPVIAPDRGLIREYLPEGAGILFDPHEPLGLIRALERTLECDSLAMGKRGRTFARRLNWREIAHKHAHFYARLTGKAEPFHQPRIAPKGEGDTRMPVISR